MASFKEQAEIQLEAAAKTMVRPVITPEAGVERTMAVGLGLGFAGVFGLLAIAEAVENVATAIAETHTDSIDTRKGDT